MRTLLILLMICSCSCLPSRFDSAERTARDRQTISSQNGTDTGDDGDVPGAGKGGAGRAGSSSAGRAGSGGHAGNGGVGGARSAGAGGGAGQTAGSAGNAQTCGDTKADPKNCGQCGNDCTAEAALFSCQSGACMRACNTTHGDCNSDLDFGTKGNGCETDLTADLANCGGCGLRCDQPADGVSVCDNRKCIAYTVHVGVSGPGANALHGSPTGGDPFDQVCGTDELMVGFDGAGDAQNLFGLATLCAHAALRGSPDALELVLGEPRMLTLLGNRITTGTMQSTTRYQCKPGEVVTAVSGGLWVIPVNPPIDHQSVKQLTVACAKVMFDRNHLPTFTSSASLGAGSQDSVVATFTDACQAGEIVSGFKVRSGAGIDAVQTQCAPLQASQ